MRKKNVTRKNQTTHKLNGVITEEKAGWKSIHIYGDPFERGYAHGYLLSNELLRVKESFSFILKIALDVTLGSFMDTSKSKINPIIKKHYPELFDEIRGISAGARRAGVFVSVDFIIAWNSFMSLYSDVKKDKATGMTKCSAFIATGSATEKGDIIMAQNTHTDFISGQMSNIIMRITPTTGHEFTMQTSPGLVASSTDWFLCSNDIIGCETTIAFINYHTDFDNGHPYFCRVRKVMQYANSLDECRDYMMNNNAGDYACSWLFGDTRNNEIMLLEIGLNENNVKRTFNGVFYGMNSAMGFRLRSLETNDVSHDDLNTSVGARNSRLDYLLNDKYKGKINIAVAKTIISDHYDGSRNMNRMGGVNVCIHPELDIIQGFRLAGCTDGKVTNSAMATKMQSYGRFGSSCGRIFRIKDHTKAHPEHKAYEEHLNDFPYYKWVSI